MARESLKAPELPETAAHTGPDPVAVVLPALAALGSIVSIAALGWVGRDGSTPPRRGRRNAGAVLKDLERDCRDLQDAFKRIVRGLPALASGGGGTTLPMKFGMHALAVPEHGQALYLSLLSSVSGLLLRTGQHSHELMGTIEDGSLEPTEAQFQAFGDAQERLNAILVARASMKTAIETGYDIAVKLTTVLAEMRERFVGA